MFNIYSILFTLVFPFAESPAITNAAPPLKSVASTFAPDNFLTPLIIAVLPSICNFAPILFSSHKYFYLFSNMFSIITDTPFEVTSIPPNTACMSVGNPGYGIVFISTAFSFLGACNKISSFFISNLQPHSSNFSSTGVK